MDYQMALKIVARHYPDAPANELETLAEKYLKEWFEDHPVTRMRIRVFKETEELDVMLLPHKDTTNYSFVNLTKGHICKCVFSSLDEALMDLDMRLDRGLILNYRIEEEM